VKSATMIIVLVFSPASEYVVFLLGLEGSGKRCMERKRTRSVMVHGEGSVGRKGTVVSWGDRFYVAIDGRLLLSSMFQKPSLLLSNRRSRQHVSVSCGVPALPISALFLPPGLPLLISLFTSLMFFPPTAEFSLQLLEIVVSRPDA